MAAASAVYNAKRPEIKEEEEVEDAAAAAAAAAEVAQRENLIPQRYIYRWKKRVQQRAKVIGAS